MSYQIKALLLAWKENQEIPQKLQSVVTHILEHPTLKLTIL